MCFGQLYRAHTPAMYLLALRLLGGAQASAEDAVQEAWIRAIRALSDFRWQSSLRTWLCGIAINCCREAMRRNRHALATLGSEEFDALELPAPPQSSAGGDLETLIRALPDGYREVLVLHDVEGYTHEEIAAQLGIEIGTSKSQLSRARATLRRRLGSERA